MPRQGDSQCARGGLVGGLERSRRSRSPHASWRFLEASHPNHQRRTLLTSHKAATLANQIAAIHAIRCQSGPSGPGERLIAKLP